MKTVYCKSHIKKKYSIVFAFVISWGTKSGHKHSTIISLLIFHTPQDEYLMANFLI